MRLHEDDIAILEYDLEVLQPVIGAFARTLDARLFDTDPSLRLLFDLPLSGSGRKLAGGLQALVGSLRRPSVLEPMLYDYGARCARRGVRERDYRSLAAVVIASVADVLEDEFDDQSRYAWGSLADHLTALMIEGARASFIAAVSL